MLTLEGFNTLKENLSVLEQITTFNPVVIKERSWLVSDSIAQQKAMDKLALYASGHNPIDFIGDKIQRQFYFVTDNLLAVTIKTYRTRIINGAIAYYVDVFAIYKYGNLSIEVCINKAIYNSYNLTHAPNKATRQAQSVQSTDNGRLILCGLSPSDIAITLWERDRELKTTSKIFPITLVGKFIGHESSNFAKKQKAISEERKKKQAKRKQLRQNWLQNGLTTSQKRKAKKLALIAKYRGMGDIAMLNHIATLPLSSF